jgi:hypothetical protein
MGWTRTRTWAWTLTLTLTICGTPENPFWTHLQPASAFRWRRNAYSGGRRLKRWTAEGYGGRRKAYPDGVDEHPSEAHERL